MSIDKPEYTFVVKERSAHSNISTPADVFIAFEPLGTPLGVLAGGLLTLDLKSGVTLEEAKRLANQLNGMATGLSFTAST
jgi:hypothetical protein